MRLTTATVALALALLASVSGHRDLLSVTPQQNYNPVNITVNQDPFDILATPITPDAPYSQKLYQCNLTGDSRYPPYALGTYPLTVRVPSGKRVRVIFANGNLNGASVVTQNGEPGVVVQKNGIPIVNQKGGASPIVQGTGSPVAPSKGSTDPMNTPTMVQPTPAKPAATVPGSTPVLSLPTPSSTQAPAPTPILTLPGGNTPAGASGSVPPPTTATPPPAATPPSVPVTPPPAPYSPGTPPPTPGSPAPPQGPPTPASPAPPQTPPSPTPKPLAPPTPPSPTPPQAPPQTPPATTPPATPLPIGRRLLQETVPGGPNNGLVEYVALASNNTVPGFVVPNTQFGVPYVEFTASRAAVGQTATFRGVLQVAQVVGGVPQYPFRPNARLSPECQVNVNFVVV